MEEAEEAGGDGMKRDGGVDVLEGNGLWKGWE